MFYEKSPFIRIAPSFTYTIRMCCSFAAVPREAYINNTAICVIQMKIIRFIMHIIIVIYDVKIGNCIVSTCKQKKVRTKWKLLWYLGVSLYEYLQFSITDLGYLSL